ncbi:MAG: hypothetical protein AAGG50_00575 [Bacteroidota bacterium]
MGKLKIEADSVIRYTGATPVPSPPVGEVWVSRPISGEQPLSEEEAAEIVSWMLERGRELPSILRVGLSRAVTLKLSILCQGFIAVYLNSEYGYNKRYWDTLGLSSSKMERESSLLKNLDGRRGEVSASTWWLSSLEEPSGRERIADPGSLESRKARVLKDLEAELGSGFNLEGSNIAQLIDEVYSSGSLLNDIDMVAEAFLEIASILK